MRCLLFFVFLSLAAPAFAEPAIPQLGEQASGESVTSVKSVACELLRLRRMSYVVHMPCRGGESAAAAAIAGDVPLFVISILAATLPDAPTVPEADRAVERVKTEGE